MRERMRDAAFADNIIKTGWKGTVGGYLHTGEPFHSWPSSDWRKFDGQKKLPIMIKKKVANVTGDGNTDAFSVLKEVYALRIPVGTMVVCDIEGAVVPNYVRGFGNVLRFYGYKVVVYGSSGNLFKNPALDGYFVAAPADDHKPYMYSHDQVIMTQYDLDVAPGIDRSTIRWAVQLSHWWI